MAHIPWNQAFHTSNMLVMSVKVTLRMRVQTIFVQSSLSSVRVLIILSTRSDDFPIRWLL